MEIDGERKITYLPAFNIAKRYPDNSRDIPSCCAWRIIKFVGRKTPQKKKKLPRATRQNVTSLNGAKNWLSARGVGLGGRRDRIVRLLMTSRPSNRNATARMDQPKPTVGMRRDIIILWMC
jgi:hypothetical protein